MTLSMAFWCSCPKPAKMKAMEEVVEAARELFQVSDKPYHEKVKRLADALFNYGEASSR